VIYDLLEKVVDSKLNLKLKMENETIQLEYIIVGKKDEL
jgi:hypothetical protein